MSQGINILTILDLLLIFANGGLGENECSHVYIT